MTENSIANIGFSADTSGLDKATAAQEKLINVSGKTEKATERLMKSIDGLGAELSGMSGILGLIYQANLKMVSSLDKIAAGGSRATASVQKVAQSFTNVMHKADGTTSTMQHLTNVLAGVKEASENAATSSVRYGMMLDDIRAKYNPMFAASRQYEIALRDIAEAERLGAISAREAATARQTAAAAMTPMTAQMMAAGQAANMTGHYVGQLGYQLNDIGMMMALGQNPFMLMMQQGPQVSQIFQDMQSRGLSLGGTIKSAFMNMLSPVTFVTMAVIGFGAAAVQYFTGAGEATKTLQDNIDDLGDSVSRLNEINKVYTSDGLQDLIEKYGTINSEILEMIENQRTFAIGEAMQRATAAANGLVDALGLIPSSADKSIKFAGTAAANLGRDLGLSVAQVFELGDAMKALRNAKTFDQQASALHIINGLLAQSTMAVDDVTGKALEAENQLRQLAEAAPGGGWMNGAISGLTALGVEIGKRIKDAAALRAEMPGQGGFTPEQIRLQGSMQYGGRGGDPRINPQSNTFSGSVYTPDTGGGGGGASKALSEMEKIAEQFSKISEPFDQAKSAFDAIDTAMENGVITLDQYSSALTGLEAAFLKAGGSATQWGEIMSRETKSVSAQIKELQKSGIESLDDAIADLAVDGSFDFGQLAKSIIKDLIKISWQAAVTKPLLDLLGLSTGAMVGPSTSAANVNAQPFAKGSAFTNSIASSPTLFAFANGGALGVMGEAGPEAVMPLSRGPDGSLGVQMHGAAQGSGGGNQMIVQVVNNANNTSVSQERQMQGDGTEIQRIIIDTVNEGTANGEFDAVQGARYGNRQNRVVR